MRVCDRHMAMTAKKMDTNNMTDDGDNDDDDDYTDAAVNVDDCCVAVPTRAARAINTRQTIIDGLMSG